MAQLDPEKYRVLGLDPDKYQNLSEESSEGIDLSFLSSSKPWDTESAIGGEVEVPSLFETPSFIRNLYDKIRPTEDRMLATSQWREPELRTAEERSGLVDLAESISTPGDIALMLGTSGAGVLPTGLRTLARTAGIGLAGRGVEQIREGNYGVGIAEIAGGLLGAKYPITFSGRSAPRIDEELVEQIPIEQVAQQLPLPLNNPIERLREALHNAVPLERAQRDIYRQERARRIAQAKAADTGGEAGFHNQLSALRGEMDKVEFTPLRDSLDQSYIDSLINQISVFPEPDEFTKIHAKEGLVRILSGEVPQRSQQIILRRIFGEEVMNDIDALTNLVDREGSAIFEIWNLPRGLMSSIDLSAPLRQGITMIHRKEWWTSFDDMFKSLGSERGFRGVQESIEHSPNYQLSQRAGLQLTDLTRLNSREESRMSTWSERIWGIGRGVRASNRAYVGFLNKLRSDTFNSLVESARLNGINVEENIHVTSAIARYINAATGRGNLGVLEDSAQILNQALFSPRMIASRVNMMNPSNYINPEYAPLRKEYIKSMASLVAFWTSMTGLATLAGADTSTDPTNSDFGKIKIGDTRIDPPAGFQQYLVLFNRLAQQRVTSTRGNVTDLTDPNFGQRTGEDIIYDFFRAKAHPSAAFGLDMLRATGPDGRPLRTPERILELFIPMFLKDVAEVAQEEPGLLPFTIPLGALGMGSQTF